MANADFVASYYPFASRVASMTGIDPRLVLAQAALETGWGKSAPGQNYFGIKAPSGDTMPTLEYVNGRPVQTRAAFRSYESPEQSFEDYARLMSSPRYERVRTSPTLEAQAEALQAAGYATDPDYAKKLVQIASGIPQTGARGVADRAMVELGRTRPQPAGGEVMDGLLGNQRMEEQPAQAMAQPERRGLGATFSDPAFMENLALAFNTLRMRPDQNLATVISGRQERRAETATRNRTIELLRQRGLKDLADAVESGAIDARTAAAELLKRPERTAMQQNYEFLVAQGMTPEQALQAVRSGTTVNLPGAPTIGTIPQGYQAIQDPATGAYRFEPIPGGPAEAQAQATEAQKAEQQALGARAGGVVLEDIGRIQKIAEQSNLPIAGPIGSALSRVPGTNAYDVSALTQTIRSNIGFDRLQQMREASPTGGALGQVSNQELSTLQAVLGNLDQSQSQQQFEYNLRRLGEIYTDIMRKFSAYPNASEFGIAPAAMPETSVSGMPDFSKMTDAELDAYIAEQGRIADQLRGR